MRLITTILLLLPIICKAQNFYLSATGNDGNNGLTKETAKATIKSLDSLINTSTIPNVVAAIQGGGEFRQDAASTLLRGSVTVDTYDRDLVGKSALPKFIGTTIHNSGWTLTGSNTYQKSITHTISVGTGTVLNGYAWVYVIEIDTAMERTAPLTARKYLTWKWNVSDVEATAGTYSVPSSNPSSSPVTVSIHTSNNTSPNNNSQFRYEVVTSQAPVYKGLGATAYGHKISTKGIFALDYGSGVGAIASALDSFTLDGSVIMGTAIHASVFGNYSTIKNSAYIGGDPTINDISVVFYQTQGAHETNSVFNTTFLGNNKGIYTHATANPTTLHGKLSVKNSYFYNSQLQAIGAADCDTLEVDYVYADSTKDFIRSFANNSYISNSIVRNGQNFSFWSNNIDIRNCFFKTSPYQYTNVVHNRFQNRSKVTNTTIHIKNPYGPGNIPGILFYATDTSTRFNAQHNIFILESRAGLYTLMATANTWAGAGTGPDSFDYNAYVIVSGNPYWGVKNPASNGGNANIENFNLWRTQSGQESHSIVIDLRNRNIPLTDIFVDPDNGNYSLTNSVRADSIRAISAGMTTPVLRWPSVPTREQVLATVTDSTFVDVSYMMDPDYVPPAETPPVIIPESNIRGSKRIGANLKFQ